MIINFLMRAAFNRRKLLQGLHCCKFLFDHTAYQFSLSKNACFSFALGNIPGSSQTEQITLPENVPDWSIWSSNYKSAGMRQKEKCEEETKKKRSCGAFMVTVAASCLV